jgi:hypothetical protein
MQVKRARPIVRTAAVAAAFMLAGLALPGTALGQGSAGPGPGLPPVVSEVLGIQVQGPTEAPAAQPPAPPVSEVLGTVVQAPAAPPAPAAAAPPAPPPAAAPSVVAPPPTLEEVAGRSIASPPEEGILAMAPGRPGLGAPSLGRVEAGTLGSRTGAGLPTAHVLPKAGDGPKLAPGVWPPLLLAGAALALGILGLMWPLVPGRASRPER